MNTVTQISIITAFNLKYNDINSRNNNDNDSDKDSDNEGEGEGDGDSDGDGDGDGDGGGYGGDVDGGEHNGFQLHLNPRYYISFIRIYAPGLINGNYQKYASCYYFLYQIRTFSPNKNFFTNIF